MTDKTIIIEKLDSVATIYFARPKHNVFNIDMMNLFCETLENLSKDPDIKCLVIRGQGSSWCAGVDVGDHKPDMVDQMIATFNRSLTLLEALKMPTVAAVHGACLGGGMEYAIACDVIIAGKVQNLDNLKSNSDSCRHTPPYAFPNWSARQKPLKSAAPAKSIVPMLPNPWGLSA